MIRKIWANRWVRTGVLLALFAAYCILMTLFVGSACPLYLVVGLPCPACGMTRAWFDALTFQFSDAFTMHPLFPLAAVAAGELLLILIRPAAVKKKWFSVLNIVLAVAFLVTYAVRMALYFPSVTPMVYNRESVLYLIIHAIRGY